MTKAAETSFKHQLLTYAQAAKPSMVEWRRVIHTYPELSFNETETSQLVAETLTKMGFEVRTGIVGTGLTADMGSGKTIVVRADLDALPIDETGSIAYASRNEGVMHACGHDAHVACALGAASLVAKAFKAGAAPRGRIRFLFQPAEEQVNAEGKSAAAMMIAENALADAEGIIALHVFPDIPVGQIAIKEGPFLTACDTFDIKIKGRQSHGAYPQDGVDAIILASQVVQAIQSIISRRKSALDPAIMSLGGIRSTTYRHNIMAEEVELTGTARYFDATLHEHLRGELHRACSIAEVLGGSYSMSYVQDNPPVVNDPELTRIVRDSAISILGGENVLPGELQMGADDFAFFSDYLPGCYFFLGAEIAGDRRKLHTSTFDIDESALPLGAAILARAALSFLEGE